MNIERIIIKNLIYNEDYVKLVLPYLKKEYFKDISEQKIYSIISNHYMKYNKSPSLVELGVEISNVEHAANQETYNQMKLLLDDLQKIDLVTNNEWLRDSTEKFCRDRAIYLAMLQSMQIIEGKDKDHETGHIPNILSEALAITFDPDIGHDYLEDMDRQFEYYHKVENRIRFDLEMLNKITNGGLPEKTLTVLLAGVHVGKTLTMCHMAAGFLAQGYDVLYITLEMGQEEIARRIDANLMGVPINQLETLSREDYLKKAQLLKSKTNGRLIIKEYPTTTASSLHFRSLLDELALKKRFKPHVIFVDYINLCASSRYKHGTGMYEYIKGVAEELRGIAGIYKTRVITATQLNREGFKSSDPDMTNTAESFGLPATADFMLAIVTNDQLKMIGELLFIQLKNRLGDANMNSKFFVAVIRELMMLKDAKRPEHELTSFAQPETQPRDEKFARIQV